jgi:hypothetical protein
MICYNITSPHVVAAPRTNPPFRPAHKPDRVRQGTRDVTTLRIESFPSAALPPLQPNLDHLPMHSVAIASAHPAILFEVRRREVNLAVWHRELPPALGGKSLRRLMQAAPFTAVAEGEPDAVAAVLSQRLPAPAPADLLLDLTDLAHAFAMVDRGGTTVRVRLEALTHDGCSRWHADAIGLRLLCTYRGSGTEWLPLDGGAETARAIPRDAAPPCMPARLGTGSVAMLKGEAYPGNESGGCIHRSPPAGPGSRARLLLCIDQTRWNLPDDET